MEIQSAGSTTKASNQKFSVENLSIKRVSNGFILNYHTHQGYNETSVKCRLCFYGVRQQVDSRIQSKGHS